MATLTYIFPFHHEPTVEEMARHDELIVDADFEAAESASVIHSLNCVPGTQARAVPVPSDLVAFAIRDYTANSVTVDSGGAGKVRLYFSRLR